MTSIHSVFVSLLISLLAAAGSSIVGASGSQGSGIQGSGIASERPLLWKIEGRKPSYLFGTIHIPDDRVLNLHQVVKEALEVSDAVYLEIPLGIKEMEKIQQGSRLSGGQLLPDLIPSDLYHDVEKLLRSRGVSMAVFLHLKIWALASRITMLDYLPVMMIKPSLDLFLYHQAQLEGKEVGALESVEEQLSVFEAFSTEEQLEFLRTTVEEMQKPGESPVERLLQRYLVGDVDALSREISRQMTKDDVLSKKVRRVMLTERDRRLADRIEQRLKESPEKGFFFAVGAAHLSEKDSILSRLSERGFIVNRVSTGKALGPLYLGGGVFLPSLVSAP